MTQLQYDASWGALLQYCTELYYSTLTSTARPSFPGECVVDQITLHFLARSFGMIDERGFQVNDEIDITTWRVFPGRGWWYGYCGRFSETLRVQQLEEKSGMDGSRFEFDVGCEYEYSLLFPSRLS